MIGKGRIRFVFPTTNGSTHSIECNALYVPGLQQRIFSPQRYVLDEDNSNLSMHLDRENFTIIRNNQLTTTIPWSSTHLPYATIDTLPTINTCSSWTL